MSDNNIRVGRVSSINYETGMLKVTYSDKDGAVTADMPYVTYNNEYCMPSIGAKVLVAHLSNGSSKGVVIGTIWNDTNRPIESGEGLYRKEFSKGNSYIKYSDDTLEIVAPNIILTGNAGSASLDAIIAKLNESASTTEEV